MSDGSSEQPKVTAGLDLGDKYSYLCLVDTESGEVMEEGRLRTAPETLRRRFSSEQQPLRIAIEAGTHSPWVSRLLEKCGYEVLVANPRSLEAEARTLRSERQWRWRESSRCSCTACGLLQRDLRTPLQRASARRFGGLERR